MRPTPLLILLGCLLAGNLSAQSSVAPDDPRIAAMGRTELASGKLRMGFPGITIRFKYRGPAPILKFTAGNADCYFNVACNGWDPVMLRLKPGANEIALSAGPAPQEGWVVEVVRRTESWMGIASFDGLVLPAGCELLPPPAWPERKLLIIGDSITCGEDNECFPPENDRSPRTTNIARSYGMLLAKWLNAQVHIVGYGGRGIVRNWDGRRDVNTVPVFFERSMPDDPATRWNHAAYQPDLIVINVGTDHDKDILPQAELTEAYGKFVARVREVHPKAWIVVTESGFHADAASGHPTAMRDEMLKTLKAVVAARHAAGDDRVRLLHCGFYPSTPPNPHVVAFQHEQIALTFLGPIKQLTGL